MYTYPLFRVYAVTRPALSDEFGSRSHLFERFPVVLFD